jgi:LuxR family maltose regulon positive regulatory protein
MVVPTCVMLPQAAHDYVEREVIEQFAHRVAASRVVTVISPAGFGKTTAMRRWLEILRDQGRPVIWVATRAGIVTDQDLAAAIVQAARAAGFALDGADVRDWTTSLIANSETRPVLFIDDGQLLSPESLALIDQLIASARDALTTVIASRGESGLKLGRLRSMNYLLEVKTHHLCFDSVEGLKLVLQIDRSVPEAEAMHIVTDAQGWAAGLVLAAQAWTDDREEGRSISGGATGLRREFSSYFAEEVLEGLPQDIRDFLVNTSILSELTPAACAAVTGSASSRTLLEEAFRRGLFITDLDRERGRYCYYALFRQMIMRRLANQAPECSAELHRRASRHYVAVGEIANAIEHAEQSGDGAFLAETLEGLADTMTYSGLLYRLDAIASALPWEQVRSQPNVLLAMSWRRARRLAFRSAERMIEAAVVAIAHRFDTGKIDEYTRDQFDLKVRHRRIMVDAARDNMAVVERESEALLADLGEDHPYLSCTLLAQLLSARRELYHFHDMLRLEAELRKALGRPGSDFASIALKASVAPTLVAQGKTEIARQFLLDARQTALSRDGEVSGLAALPSMPLAEIHYDCGELAEAAKLVEAHLPQVRQWGFVDQLASGYIVRARLAEANGDLASALSGLAEAHIVAIECGLDRMRALVIAEKVRMLVKNNRLEEAEHIFWSSDLMTSDEPVPTLNPTRLNEWIAIAWLRLEMNRFRLARSGKIAQRWLEFVRKRGAIRSAVTFELLLAENAMLAANRAEARRRVRAAIELAEPAGWVRPFIDEGEIIRTLILDSYGNGPLLDTPAERFAAKLVACLQGSDAPAKSEETNEDDEMGIAVGLSHREIEILQMVNGGLRNREIGDRLGLTEGTVKWYMQQIYDKLGVRRRPQAVVRARQFGFLA